MGACQGLRSFLADQEAKRTGEDLGANPYGYRRAFTYAPNRAEGQWIRSEAERAGLNPRPLLLDPTAGGGSIPLEAIRLGLDVISNDINPVASLIEKATIEYPYKYGLILLEEYERLSKRFLEKLSSRASILYPPEPAGEKVLGYIWAREITCPYCAGRIPLAPGWKLDSSGVGIRLSPACGAGPGDKGRKCEFELVNKTSMHSRETIKSGSAICPYDDCGRVVSPDLVKQQFNSGDANLRLFAIAGKKTCGRSGKNKGRQEKTFRTPREQDINDELVTGLLADKLPEWEALGLIPSELISGPLNYERGHKMYGINKWMDFFAPRQLLGFGFSTEVFHEIFKEEMSRSPSGIDEITSASLVYIALAIDKLISFSNVSSRWEANRGVVCQLFERHNFAIKWTSAEMPLVSSGDGIEWVLGQVSKAYRELVELLQASASPLSGLPLGQSAESHDRAMDYAVTTSCSSGADLGFIADNSVDLIVLDPPYYDNVMYAELSDFFYVWLKRTAGLVLPDLFASDFTNKADEAVANPALFKNSGSSANALANISYQQKMGEIFTECKRVLSGDGIMTLMFTHKATGAWDALTKGLISSGFAITASWPVNTEAEGSLHIKDKSAANSTIFLVCRPRPEKKAEDGVRYWEDLEPLVKAAVRQHIEEFQAAGIRGVDLYLSCFGPALEEFSLHWPIKRGQPRLHGQKNKKRRGAQHTLDELLEQDDPYAVSPEDALEAARREVKAWRMEKLTSGSRRAQLDPLTEWFVLAWDAFEAPQFPYDEALRLARVVGLDLDKDVVGVLAEKKTSDLILWDSSTRAAKGKLGAPDGTKSWIDSIHHCAHRARSIDLNAARQLLDDNGLPNSPIFLTALEAVLEVLPLSARYTGFDPVKAAVPAASDFEALENLRRLALAEQVPAPKQLELVLAELAEA
jgi:adenine-specific DNA methylase